MPARHPILQSVSFLLTALTMGAVPAPAPAQAPAKSAVQNDTVLFDFENGNFDGWTLSGDCWDKHSATVKTFIDRQGNPLVSGIVGKGYITTLFKSAATTGKAVSRDFTIDKPFLTFRIGGGHYPKEACLNLVIDGKVVRSETGNDSAELAYSSWDVSLLAEKIAHLEIVDTTSNPKRGYIMVDDIALSVKSNLPDQILPASEPVLDVPVRIIHILDAQGNAEFFGDIHTVMTLAMAREQIAEINAIYRPCKIHFSLASSDFETRRDDKLNLDFDAPAPGAATNNHDTKPPEIGKQEHYNAFQRVADEHKDMVTIIAHRGSEWRWNEKTQGWDYAVGFSHGGNGFASGKGNFVRISGTKPRVWAHELGHAFGLPHTSKDGVDAPASLVTPEQISAACEKYLAEGGDPDHPEYAIDGDCKVGVYDTPPDPGLGFWGTSKDLTRAITIRLTGRKPFSLVVSRNNIMGAVADYSGFSRDQILVMRRKITAWKDNKNGAKGKKQ